MSTSRFSVEPTKAVIAGGTGTLGRRVADALTAHGYDVLVLTRSPRPGFAHRQMWWDGRTVGPWAAELADAVVVNLAGELVDRRPTDRNVELLRRSRVEPTEALVRATESLDVAPRWWVQMSTLAIYGDAGDVIVTEGHPPADGPPQMPGVALPWEAAMGDAWSDRRVVLRTALVFDRAAPALARLVRLTRLGLGGRIAGGDQWVSWVHVADFLGALRFTLDQQLTGVVHLTAPAPVRNRELMAALRSLLHRPWSPPTPRPFVQIGAWLMGTDPALALTGRRCLPQRLTDAGYVFGFPTLAVALTDLLCPRGSDERNAVPAIEAGCRPLVG